MTTTLRHIIEAADLGALAEEDQPIGAAYIEAHHALRASGRDLTKEEAADLRAALDRLNSAYDDNGYVIDAPKAHIETAAVCAALEHIAAWQIADSVGEAVGAHRHGRATLREGADTRHEDAEDWWENLGMCSPIDNSTAHPVCSLDEIDTYEPQSEAEADCLEYGRAAADDARSIGDLLDAAVAAYERGDLDAVMDALSDASRIEREYGDDPAARELAQQMILVRE